MRKKKHHSHPVKELKLTKFRPIEDSDIDMLKLLIKTAEDTGYRIKEFVVF